MLRNFSTLKWRKPTGQNWNIKMTQLQGYDYYLVLDFESTCDRHTTIRNQEIIEFPCIWVDSNLSIVSVFHQYVKPVHNSVLTPFCTELTGITQTMVEKEDTFHTMLTSFLRWHNSIQNSIGKETKKTFVTCGDWDLKIMLPDQCRLSGIPVPASMTQWLNLKNVFMESTGYYPKSLRDMCRYIGVAYSGREHSGIDDCKNILEIMRVLKLKSAMPNMKSS